MKISRRPNFLAHRARRAAGRITLGYAAAGLLWILLSDRALQWVDLGSSSVTAWSQTLKGSCFVLVSAGLIYSLCYHQLRRAYRIKARWRGEVRRFRTLVSNLPGAVYRCRNDPQWTMLFLSDRCRDITGRAASELLADGVGFDGLIHPEDLPHVRRIVDDAVAQRVPFYVEYRICRPDGEERWVGEHGRAAGRDKDGTPMLDGYIADVTDRRRAAHLEAERSSLLQQSRAAEGAVRLVAHELRTPLTAVRAMAEYLIEEPGDTEVTERYLTDINAQAARMTQMINEMLEAARLKSGGQQWDWAELDASRIVTEAIDMVRPMLRGGVGVEFETCDDETPMRGDPDAIRRLVINLLSNASRYSLRGDIQVRLERGRDTTGELLRLQVRDTGPGIAPALRDKLGIPFALARGTDRAAASYGTGLGLAICAKIAAVHGGQIDVVTEPRVGSTVNVTLRPDLPEPSPIEPASPIPCRAIEPAHAIAV
ncbi:MAG: PAS domain-containing sensor histidine kinase [Phycisphaeraceae bacterium]